MEEKLECLLIPDADAGTVYGEYLFMAFFGKMFRFVWSMEDLVLVLVFMSHMVGKYYIVLCILTLTKKWMQILFD